MMARKEGGQTVQPLQERILDAVESCFARYGIQKTTLADIAAEVGISRMTLYRQFKDRRALFNGAVLRNLHRHWQKIGDLQRDIDELGPWLLEATLFYQRELSQDSTVQLYAQLGAFSEGITVALSEPGLAPMIEQFQPLFDRAAEQGQLAPGITAEDIAEWVHRMNHTLMNYPSPRLQDEADLRRWLGAQINGR